MDSEVDFEYKRIGSAGDISEYDVYKDPLFYSIVLRYVLFVVIVVGLIRFFCPSSCRNSRVQPEAETEQQNMMSEAF